MPVAQGPRFDLRSVAVIAGIALGVAFAIGIVAILSAQSSGEIEVRLGSDTFGSLDATAMADEIAENGPILFPDVGGGTRDIWLQHLGADAESGWFAFDARRAGAERECNVTWNGATRSFDDPCAEGVSYPADGAGLDPIAVYVSDGELEIDLNDVRGDAPSSTGV